jgi:hypothetical protein
VERLIAWYRVGSSWGAVAALVVANAVPLLGVVFLGWNVWTMLTIYWLENGVVGFFNVLKMTKASAAVPGGMAMEVNGRPVVNAGAAKAVLIPFFVVHYGLFWLVHGVFVLTLPQFMTLAGETAQAGGATGITSDPLAFVIVLVGLFISHGISYRLNYIGRGEYLRKSVGGQMFAPYGRLVVLHITIILGAMAVAVTGAPAAAVLILVVLKTALDLALHLAEHRPADTA